MNETPKTVAAANEEVMKKIFTDDLEKAQGLWKQYQQMYKPKGAQAKKYFIAGAVSTMSFVRHMNKIMAEQQQKGKEDGKTK